MVITQSIFLGVIQGLTEFLPVSSSGHLIFLPEFFGWADQGLAFDVVMHLGTLLALIIFFRKKLWNILKAVFFLVRKKELEMKDYESKMIDCKLGWLIVLSIIPAGIVGLLFGDWIETSLRSPVVIGVSLIFWGIVLGFADKYSRRLKIENQKSLGMLGWKNVLFIGCAQAVALIPGTSRSGITMTAGLLTKLDKKSVAEFSFFMSVPVIALAGFLKIIELWQNGLGDLSIVVLSIGFLASALSGLVAISGLMKIIQKWSFMPFVVYRVVVGIFIIIVYFL
ncbi:MAG: undecaprenyl-diphosphatase [Candidatus Magasanikbacteria bacterium CG_4_10_14_0_2_um_filter_37_12]|uniref:Undecaprenyl-diphosphatase n=1 Tax=Candidatus Magasanikbacteria bacterium CG_4_10_14_0_2_um_filter_37_12 TaxID=1974637 RepID=A0A2M7V7V5_9BACT|nr:MAG: undecaprenyl-diphosphatase [Candidatus Magasanikbacteria bacterium CG_4_10_14_0_2_um_filter_37_12]